MILVDMSIWVDHLRKSNQTLADLLEHGAVLIHPWIIG
jgi:predicted nucleic acid-binding protein